MTTPRRTALLPMLAATLLLTGCTWIEPANRRTWNLYEEHLVPESEPAYSLTLPLTATGGLVALLLDVVVVHPIASIDDAALQSTDLLWDDANFGAAYYTECALVPARAVGTLVHGVSNWVFRVLLPIDPYPPPSDEERAAARDAAQARRAVAEQTTFLEALKALEQGDVARLPDAPQPPWRSSLTDAVREGLAWDDPSRRASLLRALRLVSIDGLVEPWAGLSDPDPRVRALLLGDPLTRSALPPDLAERLRNDPDPIVAFLAKKLLER